ncbi:MAG TPA: hypothetical protein VFD82_00250 [Planctomycetota bacterium]|nr:hypothetical protein [Planctomycetota bacterium]
MSTPRIGCGGKGSLADRIDAEAAARGLPPAVRDAFRLLVAGEPCRAAPPR